MKKIHFTLLVFLLLTACVSKPDPSTGSGRRLAPGSPLKLTSFTENSVTVSITLELDSAGQTFLAATFTPTDPTFHVYSIDIPRDGVNGLGRPTLLELGPDSKMQVAGSLTASATATDADIDGLPTYPAGPVTLRLPITLPPGDGWFDESVSVTYMSCGSGVCNPPVIGKIVPVRVPGAEVIQNP
jgi:hypothetical protein